MTGPYRLHLPLGVQPLALDDDGGEPLVSFARSHGLPVALRLVAEWLVGELAREDAEAEARRRRQRFRVVPPNSSLATKPADADCSRF